MFQFIAIMTYNQTSAAQIILKSGRINPRKERKKYAKIVVLNKNTATFIPTPMITCVICSQNVKMRQCRTMKLEQRTDDHVSTLDQKFEYLSSNEY